LFREESDMVTIGMNYKMIPGKEKIFEDAFSKVIDVMNEMEGHSKSSLYKDVSDPQSYLIVQSGTLRTGIMTLFNLINSKV